MPADCTASAPVASVEGVVSRNETPAAGWPEAVAPAAPAGLDAEFNKAVCRYAAAQTYLFADSDPPAPHRQAEFDEAAAALVMTRAHTPGNIRFKLHEVLLSRTGATGDAIAMARQVVNGAGSESDLGDGDDRLVASALLDLELINARKSACDALNMPSVHDALPFHDPREVPLYVHEALLDDIRRLAEQDSVPCAAARLFAEHGPVYAEDRDASEKGELERPSCRRNKEIEEQASWARARTLKGAMYQVALAVGRNDLMGGEDDLVQQGLDHAYIDRLLMSALDVLHQHCGGEVGDLVDAYAGLRYRKVELLSDDPQPFDAAELIDRYAEAGGQLYLDWSAEGREALVDVAPRDPTALREIMAGFAGDLTKREAVMDQLRARRTYAVLLERDHSAARAA